MLQLETAPFLEKTPLERYVAPDKPSLIGLSREQLADALGDIGVAPKTHPTIPGVVPGDPAEKAGVKAGDLVLAVDGRTINFGGQLSDAIKAHTGGDIMLRVERDGRVLDIPVAPV